VNDELGRIRKNEIVAYFKEQCQLFPRRTENTHEEMKSARLQLVFGSIFELESTHTLRSNSLLYTRQCKVSLHNQGLFAQNYWNEMRKCERDC
jgi:hypothetical protein